MQPTKLEELLTAIRVLSTEMDLKFIHIVMAAADGRTQFIESSRDQFLENELKQAIDAGFLALGLLGWEMSDSSLEAKSLLFPWNKGDENLKRVFQRICEAGVDSVYELLQKKVKPN